METKTSQLRTAIYARVSTEDQTVQPQLIELREVARQRGMNVVEEFTDVISGAKASREGLDRMIDRVQRLELDAVMVVKIDRLARSLSHFARLCDLLKKNRVALIIPGQGIDTSKDNPCGEMQLGVLAVIAQFERSLIRERTRAGLVAARANGKTLGRPSKILPPQEERDRIIIQWIGRGGRNYRALGQLLGGVSGSTAWRLAQRFDGSHGLREKIPTEAMDID